MIRKELNHNNAYSGLLWIALLLGFLAEWLFYGRPLGVSFLVFSMVFLVFLVARGRRVGATFARRNLWLWILLLFFASTVFIRANPLLITLNVMISLALVAYILVVFREGDIFSFGMYDVLVTPWRAFAQSIAHVKPVATSGLLGSHRQLKPRGHVVPMIRGGMFALPLLVIFAALLSSADPVFAAYIKRGLEMAHISSSFWRATFIVLVTGAVSGSIAMALNWRVTERDSGERLPDQIARNLPIGFLETATVLTLVCVLFLAFVCVQIFYLFGGESNMVREGFTYAEYARRGFFELVFVSAFSLALILTLDWLTRRESKSQIRVFNGLGSLLIVLVLVILASALQRMRFYEAAYGYTELRLYVYVFDLWLGALLVWFLATLWRFPERFAAGFLIASLGFVGTLNIINPDVTIVRQNLARYQKTGDLDVAYLTRLSADAVPMLIETWHVVAADGQLVRDPGCYRNQIEPSCDVTMSDLLGRDLNGRYQDLRNEQQWREWPSFHLSRRRAFAALNCLDNADAQAARLGETRQACVAAVPDSR